MLNLYRIGNQLAKLRKEKGLTGEKLAEQLGVSPQAVSKWENGKCLPESTLLPQIAELLGVSVDILLAPPEEGAPIEGEAEQGLRLLGAWFGCGEHQRDVMHKMRHYEYFHWNEIHVNHESFPSSPGVDGAEYLTLVYLNGKGIHTVACPEGRALRYSADRTEIFLKEDANCMLPDIPSLAWEKGMDCCYAGAAALALQYMKEPYTYEQVMGLSGACYRLNFCDVWDWSATDALVAFDYATPLFKAIGRENIFAARVSKEDRPTERQRVMESLQKGRPVIAINLRVAPEWGIITGYAENGRVFYCRSYFDEPGSDYQESENWPFLIQYFGDATQKPTDFENLCASLGVLLASLSAPRQRGYFQGLEAYQMWGVGLLNEKLWKKSMRNKKDDIRRRLSVNESMLLNLADARRCAAAYLRENRSLLPGVSELAAAYQEIYERLAAFRKRMRESVFDEKDETYLCDEGTVRFANDFVLRQEQATLLEWAMEREKEIGAKVQRILAAHE